jgi:hypothetical protein
MFVPKLPREGVVLWQTFIACAPVAPYARGYRCPYNDRLIGGALFGDEIVLL